MSAEAAVGVSGGGVRRDAPAREPSFPAGAGLWDPVFPTEAEELLGSEALRDTRC